MTQGEAMRVLFWTEFFWPYIGGIEISSSHLLSELRRRGCEITLVTSHHNLDLPDEDLHDGIRIRRFPFQAALEERDVEAFSGLRRQIAALKQAVRPDLVHMNQVSPSSVFHLQTVRSLPTPTLTTLLAQPAAGSLRVGTLSRAALRASDGVTACCQAIVEEVRRLAPEIAPKVSVIYLGVPMPRLVPRPLPFEPPRLLCLGRIVPVKGFDLAVRAFATLAGRIPAAKLVIAGDGPMRAGLEALARDLDIADRVEFLGWVAPNEVPNLIDTATVLVMPSWSEGLPIVAIQAGQMGRPIVGTRVSGMPEIVLEGETGILVQPGDSGALTEALVRLLEDPDAARRMGRAARRRVEGRFSLERSADEYYALYERLVRGCDRAAS